MTFPVSLLFLTYMHAVPYTDHSKSYSNRNMAESAPIKSHDYSQFPKREPLPGQPNFVNVISVAEELAAGDHILYLITKSGYREVFRSCLVKCIYTSLGECHVEYFTNKEEGVVQKRTPFEKLQSLHRVEYSECRYSVEESLKRAEGRINEEYYHSLNNNSHFFVTWCKTGREQSLTDILRSLEYKDGELLLMLLCSFTHDQSPSV